MAIFPITELEMLTLLSLRLTLNNGCNINIKMAFIGELFLSEVINKRVFDVSGEEIGKLKDIVIIKGEPFPVVSGLVVIQGKKIYIIKWKDISLFNKRVISSKIHLNDIGPNVLSDDDILACRDLLDKQIVDINGAKVVRVNDIKLGSVNNYLCLLAVDIGLRGILRRLGIEKKGEKLLKELKYKLDKSLIGWHYLQTLEPKLSKLTLTIPRENLSQLHPADVADIITEVSQKNRRALFESLDIRTAAEALHELPPDIQVSIFNLMDKSKALSILKLMPPDEVADLLGDLPPERAKELLELIEEKESIDIQELLAHDEDSAGGLMTTEYISLSKDITVEESFFILRLEAPEVEMIYTIYITDDEEHLLGILSLKDLILAPPQVKLSQIMKTKIKSVPLNASKEEVAEVISKYNLIAVPVVDENNVMHGIITVDDVMDIFLPSSSRRKKHRIG